MVQQLIRPASTAGDVGSILVGERKSPIVHCAAKNKTKTAELTYQVNEPQEDAFMCGLWLVSNTMTHPLPPAEAEQRGKKHPTSVYWEEMGGQWPLTGA